MFENPSCSYGATYIISFPLLGYEVYEIVAGFTDLETDAQRGWVTCPFESGCIQLYVWCFTALPTAALRHYCLLPLVQCLSPSSGWWVLERPGFASLPDPSIQPRAGHRAQSQLMRADGREASRPGREFREWVQRRA